MPKALEGLIDRNCRRLTFFDGDREITSIAGEF